MSKCGAEKYKKMDIEYAQTFDDTELTRIADIQVKQMLHFPQGASQRRYNRVIRREIRRRGLPWKPPTSLA